MNKLIVKEIKTKKFCEYEECDKVAEDIMILKVDGKKGKMLLCEEHLCDFFEKKENK